MSHAGGLTKYNKDAYGASPACDGSGYKSAAYDALGNLTQKSDIGTYTYPVAGKAIVHAVSSISGSANGVVNPAYQYDPNGNLIGGAGRLVTWNSFNRVAEIVQATTTIGYTYDSEHERITQAVTGSGAQTTLYLNDPSSGAAEEQIVSGTTTWKTYLMADGKLVAQRSSVVGGSTIWSYFIADHLGSTAVVTDASGAVLQRLSYDAWGRHTDSVTTPATTRQFTGHEQIPVPGAGLVNMNARLYDPEIGRMMSADPTIPDPFASQSFNRFTYVNNRPLSFTDPTGFCAGSRISGGGDCFGGGGGAPYAWQDCGTFNGGSLGCTTGPTRYPGCVGNCVGLAFAGGGNVNMGLPGYIPLVQHVLLSAAGGGGGPRSMGNSAGMPAFRYGSHIRNPFPKAPNSVAFNSVPSAKFKCELDPMTCASVEQNLSDAADLADRTIGRLRALRSSPTGDETQIFNDMYGVAPTAENIDFLIGQYQAIRQSIVEFLNCAECVVRNAGADELKRGQDRAAGVAGAGEAAMQILAGSAPTLVIYPGYMRGGGGFGSYGWLSRNAQDALHEFAHQALGVHDLRTQSGQWAYGQAGVKALASEGWDRATGNADTYRCYAAMGCR